MFQNDLINLIEQFNIKSIENFEKLSPVDKHYFISRIYKCFDKGMQAIGGELSRLRGLKLHYSRDRKKTGFVGTKMEDTFYRKMSFFTSRSVITCPIEESSTFIRTSKSKRIDNRDRYDQATVRSLRKEGKYIFGDVKAHHREHGGEIHVRGRHYIIDRIALIELLDTVINLKDAIKNQLIYILPAMPDKRKKIESALKKGKVTRGNFKRDDLVRQFTERDLNEGETHIDVGLTQIYLPHFTNVPIEKIIELREKENTAYSDFQIALENFVYEAENTASETKIVEFLKILDESIRSINAEVEKVKKNWKMSRNEMIIKFMALGFVAMLPQSVAMAVAPFIGAITAFDYLKSNREFNQKKYDASSGKFYVAWKLNQLGN